ncbi:hypothetical protein TTHERM_001479589 (macronuclear) [Tetrahymena thermophila SB210]|uniref:Uncharacterized protein n=1 Tax=Tetrahymena thermophila (strain SB210) TaxID=312017 RepID=W7XL58_TETTS|nr:hypothetical protein TTHERM_001479589 [Tetrahymena thermophila SB210]EWS75714.1 hypothetical protein TTHERM_001479589 [Tetrahymena thermophila SB210]|eukprot:XP_012651751.1 hypothetical protein TTHERM_001479589 [Tetrahymena thermophila SB210]
MIKRRSQNCIANIQSYQILHKVFEFRRIVLKIADRLLSQIKSYSEFIFLIRQMHNQQNSPNK